VSKVTSRFAAQFKRRSGKRQLGGGFVLAFGVLWLVLEPLGLFFPEELDWGWAGYLVLVVVSLLFGLWRARPRNTVQRRLPPSDLTVTVKVGDVLEQAGNVVVGSNDTFDTQLEQSVISPASVQGQLLQRVFRDRDELDRQIAESLSGVQGVADPHKVFGKTTRYPKGTVAVVHHGTARFFLPAFASMTPDLPAKVTASLEDLQVSLIKTWESIGRAGQREQVHAPIIGSNMSRLGLSHTLLAQMMILSFVAAAKTEGMSASLTVWIAESDADVVDIAEIDEWLRGLCAT
jgi:hypothetical protein